MKQNEKMQLAKRIYESLDLKRYNLEIKRDKKINADFIWIPNMRGTGGFIIADDGTYLFCQSAKGYDYWKEEFKKGIRNK